MSPRPALLFVIIVLALLTSGCVAIPVSSTSSGTGTPGVPVVQEETAVTLSATPTAEQTVMEVSSTAQPAEPTGETTLTPAATVAATASLETPAAALTPSPAVEHYRGPNPYRATPEFEVAYDAAAWEYVADDGSGRPSQLKHRTMNGCTIWLQAGPVDAKAVGQAWLADRAWNVAQVQPRVIQYVSPQDDFAWIFGILLPEDFTGMANSNCQDAAAQVIDTFKVVTE